MSEYRMKRYPGEEDLFSPPSEVDAEASVKVMTFPIYWKLPGVYFCVVWDFDALAPKMMLLNHTIFPELRDYIRRDLEDVTGQTFLISCRYEGRIIRHGLHSTGMAPFLDEQQLKEIKEYVNGLYELVAEGGED